MKPQLEALKELSRIDSEIISLRREREAKPNRLEEERAALDQRRHGVTQVTHAIRELRMEFDRADRELKANRAKIDEQTVKLNAATSNEEFTILRAQIEKLNEASGELEERALEGVERLDALDVERRKLEAEIGGLEGVVARAEDDLRREIARIERRLEELGSERAALSEGISEEHLKHYERVLERHGNAGLARLDGQVCQGCHMSVTPQTRNLLLSGREIVHCAKCFRILYLDDEDR